MDLTTSIRSLWDGIATSDAVDDSGGGHNNSKRDDNTSASSLSSEKATSYGDDDNNDEERGLEVVRVLGVDNKSSPRRAFFKSRSFNPRSILTFTSEDDDQERRQPRRLLSYFQRSRTVETTKQEDERPPARFIASLSENPLERSGGILHCKSNSTEEEEGVVLAAPAAAADPPLLGHLLEETAMCGYACGRLEYCVSAELNDNSITNETYLENDDASDGIVEKAVPEPMDATSVVLSALSSPPTTAPTSANNKNKDTGKRQHFRMFGHGKLWTLLALICAWSGCICAILSRQSIRFVDLKHPLEVAPIYEPVGSIGMIRMEICYDETMTAGLTGCQTIRLSRDAVNDKVFNLARCLLALGTALGLALTVVLCTSVFWETINLRPIAFGLLLAYFFQSFSLLIFDTEICNEYKCKMAPGSILCVVASVCWLATCAFVAKMDSFKIRSLRVRRTDRKKARQESRANKLSARNQSAAEAFDTDQESLVTAVVRVEGKTIVA